MLVAAKRPDNKIVRVERNQGALILYTNNGNIKLEPRSEEIVRVVYTLKDSFSDQEKPGVICNNTYDEWKYHEDENEITLNTNKITLKLNKDTASIQYFDQNGSLLLKERDYESKNLEEFSSYTTVLDEDTRIEKVATPDGVKEVLKDANRVFDQKLYKTRLHIDWQENESIYGLGQNEEGCLDLRGTTVYLHQANKKIAIPFFVSSLGYGILVDTYSPMIFNDTNFGSYIYTEADYEMDYYFIYGSDMDGVVAGYRYLTGKASMLPKWMFGFIQSQERYETANELIEVVKEYRKRKIGLDCIVLDWLSWQGNLWGQKTFDPERFPDPSSMIEELHDNNVNLMISIWPSMSEECDNYKEFKDQGLLLPASNIYNPYIEEGRKLYWKQVKEGLYCHDIDAWWCDSSEPYTPEWNHKVEPEPSAMYNEYYNTSSQHMPAQLTNSFSLYHARTLYEEQRNSTDKKRVVNLTRSGYTGQQRYGTILWSGDISANWTSLKNQIVAGLNLCASGMPYWTLDIGAFFVRKGIQWFWDGDYDKGYCDLGYVELFTRWFQYGCFLPIFRSHGTDFRRELWYFGQKEEIFYNTLIKFNQLRYRLMPYIYSMAAKVWKSDYTLLRMLAFDYPSDEIARATDNQYMFGESLMVCPVTRPMYYGKDSTPIKNSPKTREVYLPKGAWYDFWTNDYYEGGQTITAAAPIDIIPLYVKAGSILPMTSHMQYVDELPNAPIELYVYPGMDTEFELYEDDGCSYRYEEGEFAITNISWNDKNHELVISEPTGHYEGMANNNEFIVKVIENHLRSI